HHGLGLMIAPEGPILRWHDDKKSRTGLRLLVKKAREMAPSIGAMGIRVEPRLPVPGVTAMRDFRRAPVDLVPRETLYLDLTQSPESLMQQMRPKGRYNIGLALRRGVAIREKSSADAVGAFYRVTAEAAERDQFFVEPFTFFVALAESLCPAGMARFIFAEHEGDLLGAMLLVTFGDRATYLYGGTSNLKRNLMGGYALQWGAILAAQRSGCRSYDFFGYEPFGAPSHLYSGFSRFKRQFGGEAQRFAGARDFFFLDRVADAVIRASREIEAVAPMARSGEVGES
ncbi:MAG TPA: peptidoglycan bridge formation glycyltransferase FemA/FemB family protein, partial [Chloroflexota bacterium]|nr:peptidoglycan bridge formation glycyltransferase FemA/FemB family protein [Chloroflexota bacterium]